jgi:putative transposase
MDLEDTGCRARYLIRDRDGKFPALINEILAEAGIQTVLTGIRMPRMNSFMPAKPLIKLPRYASSRI